MRENILEVENLTCGYEKFKIKEINLSVQKNKIIGIIGPNGSGKTTLLRALTRVIKPEKGRVLFNGFDIWKKDTKELSRHIAVVSQSVEAESMTIEEYTLIGRYPHYKKMQFFESDKDEKIAQKYMKMAGVLGIRDKSFNEISGGERQLAQIARALTQEPELLILDEPTSHLDIKHQVGILNLIRHLNKELNITVIMVLHDLNLASEYCDEIVLMNEGSIFKTGSPREVLNYETIEKVYQTVVIVKENPLSGKPYVFLVSKAVSDS